MEKNDIKSALICLKSLGLTESVSTLEAYYECDPNAFYVAINQNNDRIIGVCGAPVTTHSTGFFGLYGVDKYYQNRGIGRQLFELCLKHIGDKNCGLFSLPKKLYIYESFYGFKPKDSIELTIFAGIPQNIESINILMDENTEIKQFKREDTNLLSKIIEYDTKVHKQSRKTLLSLTLNKTDYKTFVIINKIDDRVLGYGCIRLDINGIALIGPVYADNDCVAEILVYNLVNYCETLQTNGLLYPTINSCQTSHRIARKLLLKQLKNSPTLYTKYSPPLNHKLIYCIHSPNFSF